MLKLDRVLNDENGDIMLLNNDGYTSLQLNQAHADAITNLDRRLCATLAAKFSFEHITSSDTLTASNLAKTNFFENLPAKPFYITASDDIGSPKRLLNPSVCYHCFDYYNRRYQQSTQLLSTAAKCFRNEEVKTFDPYRLCEFTMREFVVIGNEVEVKDIGLKIFALVKDFINEKVPVDVVNASDSFMGGNVAALKKVQRAFKLKQELVFKTPYGNISAASVNWHKKTMTSKYIERENIESCCIAVGLERLYLGTQAYAV